VSKPPVWRRITVPAGLTLDLLHEVIQQVMGWEDGHLHVFSTPWRNYGVPDSDLGYADEAKVTLAEVLAEAGTRLRYTYDFGDDWEHDIVLEKVLPPDPSPACPAWPAGARARPRTAVGMGVCQPERRSGRPISRGT